MNLGAYLLDHWWKLLALAALLAASGFFSGSETAFFKLTRGQLHRLGRRGPVGRLVVSLMRRPRRLLQALLLGNMIVNVAYSAVAALTVISLGKGGLGGWALAGLACAPVLLLILAGEVTPKMLAYRLAERWALVAASPLALTARALAPVVWVAERSVVSPLARVIAPRVAGEGDITGDELSALLDLSARRGLIAKDANLLLQEILQLTDIRVADIMVPRVDVVAYDVDGPPAGLAKLLAETHLRKIPVYAGDIDHILGVVHAKRLLLAPETPLRRLVVPVPFMPEAANIERALLQLRVKRRQMAIAVDEYGGVAGLVTLEDIIEQIVGDIEETHEAPRRPAVERIGENEYLLDGDLAVHEWLEAFHIDLAGKRISTVGGFVISLLGRIPAEGDVANYRNLRFTVEEMRRRRIGRLRLELTEVAQ